jgi:NAD(P)H-dependent flavin oxidoreductase YrpB (nitropropane dioxygenase family)
MGKLFVPGLRYPIMQAALGGGISGWELAAAVSRAGALGTVCIQAPGKMAQEILRAKQEAHGAPVAANLIVPLTTSRHIEAVLAASPAAVTLFFGSLPQAVQAFRNAGIYVFHQIGTPAEASLAIADGADALIVQGREAGGHLLGIQPTAEALQAVRAIAGNVPLWVAGGVATAADVRRYLELGAAGVACGSRFLLSVESRAHPAYKQRALGARETLETELFGFGWPARHRVLPNAVTAKWCRNAPLGPRWLLALNGLTPGLAKRVPMRMAERLIRLHSKNIPLFSPSPVLVGLKERLVEVTPLYAGECVRNIAKVLPAGEIVAMLAEGIPVVLEGTP